MEDNENKEEEKPADNTGEGDKPESTALIDKAGDTAERLENANTKTEQLLDRQEQIIAKQALGGKADAGVAPEKPVEQTAEEYAADLEDGKAPTD